jgi:hypothetical protein
MKNLRVNSFTSKMPLIEEKLISPSFNFQKASRSFVVSRVANFQVDKNKE